MPHTQKVDS